MNCILQTQEDVVYEIPQQRIIFYVKHIVSCLRQNDLPLSLHAEICKSLVVVLPHIKDIYGSFWLDIINVLILVWSRGKEVSDDDLPLIHATLRLSTALRALTTQESNDDLLNCWSEKKVAMTDGLINLMKHEASKFTRSLCTC